MASDRERSIRAVWLSAACGLAVLALLFISATVFPVHGEEYGKLLLAVAAVAVVVVCAAVALFRALHLLLLWFHSGTSSGAEAGAIALGLAFGLVLPAIVLVAASRRLI